MALAILVFLRKELPFFCLEIAAVVLHGRILNENAASKQGVLGGRQVLKSVRAAFGKLRDSTQTPASAFTIIERFDRLLRKMQRSRGK